MLIDSHCHLNSDELYPRIDEIIKEAEEAGVKKFLVVGWDKESSFKAVEIAEKYNQVYAIIGFHPSDVFGVSDSDFESVMNLGTHPKVVAIGEIGLDYFWEKDESKKEIQKQYFIRQIKEANRLKKPISIHNREAFKDCIDILNEYKPLHGGVMHCYGGSVEGLNDVLKLGLNIGLDGPVTFKNARVPKEVAKIVPNDRLILETDCPYLSPHPFRGTINEPKNLRIILKEIALLKGICERELEDITTENCKRIFNI